MSEDWMAHVFDEPVLDDCQDKYIVIKVKHAKDRLTQREKATLMRYLQKLGNENKYWIVNQDEPYAQKVFELIKTREAEKQEEKLKDGEK